MMLHEYYQSVKATDEDERANLYAMVRKHGPCSARSIAPRLGWSSQKAANILRILQRHGVVEIAVENQGHGHLWKVCKLIRKTKSTIEKELTIEKGLDAADLAWMAYWRNHRTERTKRTMRTK